MKKQQKTLAFYVEALLLTLFLLAALTILVQMFSTARATALQARQKTAAALIVQNASAEFDAGAGAFAEYEAAALAGKAQTFALSYAADGTPSDTGPYTVAVELYSEATGAGQLLHAALCVRHAGDSAPLATLNTARYCR